MKEISCTGITGGGGGLVGNWCSKKKMIGDAHTNNFVPEEDSTHKIGLKPPTFCPRTTSGFWAHFYDNQTDMQVLSALPSTNVDVLACNDHTRCKPSACCKGFYFDFTHVVHSLHRLECLCMKLVSVGGIKLKH